MQSGSEDGQGATRNPPGTLGQIQGFLDGPAFVLDFFLQQGDGVDELFGARRTSRNINIDGDDLVDALHQCVVLENAARGGTGSHGNYPLRFRHLLPQLPDHWRHLVRDAAGNDHEIALPWRGSKYFRPETRNIK